MSLSEAEREAQRTTLDEAEHNGESNQCNHCGASDEALEYDGTAMVSDLSHKLHVCSECEEMTAVYNWNGPTWRAAVQTRPESGGSAYTTVAGAP